MRKGVFSAYRGLSHLVIYLYFAVKSTLSSKGELALFACMNLSF